MNPRHQFFWPLGATVVVVVAGGLGRAPLGEIPIQHSYINLTGMPGLPAPTEAFAVAVNATHILFAGGELWDGSLFVNVPAGQVTARNHSLSVARGRGVALGCSDASALLFAGGENGGAKYATVDIFWPANQSWTVGPSLSQGRSFLGGAQWNELLFFAGGEEAKDDSSRVDVYNCTSHSFVKTAELSVPRKKLAGASANNIVAFAGGFYSAKHAYEDAVDIYNTTSGEWSTSKLSQARQYITSAAAGPFILWGGGFCSPCNNQVNSSSSRSSVVDILDTRTGTWAPRANLSQERSNGAAASVGGRYALFVGGSTDVGCEPASASASGGVGLGEQDLFTAEHPKTSLGIGRSSVVDVFDGESVTWATTSMAVGRCCVGAAGTTTLSAAAAWGSLPIVDIWEFASAEG